MHGMFAAIACFRSSIRKQHEHELHRENSHYHSSQTMALLCNFQLLIEQPKESKKCPLVIFTGRISTVISLIIEKNRLHQQKARFINVLCCEKPLLQFRNFRRVVPSNFPQNKSIKRDRHSKSRFFWLWIRKRKRERTKLQRRCNCCTKTHNHSSVQHKVQSEIKKSGPYGRKLIICCYCVWRNL